MQATILGAQEIGSTVITMSSSLIAVFIPILLMTGIVGRLFREFAVTLSAAIVISLLVSLTCTPMMCSRLLRGHNEVRHGRIYRASEAAFNGILGLYERSLGWVLRYKAATLAVTLITIGLTVYLYARIDKGFFPQQDTGRLTGTIQADQQTSFQAMVGRFRQFIDAVREDEDMSIVIGSVGGGGGLGGGNSMNRSEEQRLNSSHIPLSR